MNKIFDIKWEEFVEKIKDCKQKIILFGASSCADIFLNRMKTKFDVRYIVDNDVKKQGKKLFGYDIYPIDKLYDSKKEDILVITSTWYDEIAKQLEDIDYKGTVYSYFHMQNKAVSQQLQRESDNIDKNIDLLLDICEDEKSKNIVKTVISNLKSGNTDYSSIYEKDQYFVKELIKITDDEVFVDGGAYDGNTVDEFIKNASGKFKKIYAFEMDQSNFNKISRQKYSENVCFLNYGLWDKKEKVSFVENETASEIVDGGAKTAQCVSLDETVNEKVTFIKMDIEGAEQKALRESERHIVNDKPKLAICLYHRVSDLWEIPFYVKKLVPEYKIYIRHHSMNRDETVMYAIPE